MVFFQDIPGLTDPDGQGPFQAYPWRGLSFESRSDDMAVKGGFTDHRTPGNRCGHSPHSYVLGGAHVLCKKAQFQT